MDNDQYIPEEPDPSIYTNWVSLEKATAELPLNTIVLCWNKVLLSAPLSFKSHVAADQYRKQYEPVAYLRIPDPRPCLKK